MPTSSSFKSFELAHQNYTNQTLKKKKGRFKKNKGKKRLKKYF